MSIPVQSTTQFCSDGEGEGPDGSGLFRKCCVLAQMADTTSEMAAFDEKEPVTFMVERLRRSLDLCDGSLKTLQLNTLHQRDSALMTRGHSCPGFVVGRGGASQG